MISSYGRLFEQWSCLRILRFILEKKRAWKYNFSPFFDVLLGFFSFAKMTLIIKSRRIYVQSGTGEMFNSQFLAGCRRLGRGKEPGGAGGERSPAWSVLWGPETEENRAGMALGLRRTRLEWLWGHEVEKNGAGMALEPARAWLSLDRSSSEEATATAALEVSPGLKGD